MSLPEAPPYVTTTRSSPAAYSMPERRFVLCTDQLDGRPDLPGNVEAGLVTPERFNQLISTAGAVGVALQTDVRRIAGMLTHLWSMWCGTPTVCSRAPGADEYIEGCWWTVPPSHTPRAIQWTFDPANAAEVDAMCAAGQQAVADRFLAEHHTARPCPWSTRWQNSDRRGESGLSVV